MTEPDSTDRGLPRPKSQRENKDTGAAGRSGGSRDVRAAFWTLAGLHAAVCAATIWLAYTRGPSFQVEIFRDYADRIAAGLVPYADFPHEYPPTSLVILILPRLLTADPALYSALFSLQILFCSVLILYLMSRLGLAPLVLYGVGMLLFWRVPYIRHDLVPVLVATLGAFAVLRGRTLLAALLWGLGGALKLYPVVAAPVLAFGNTLKRTFLAWTLLGVVFLAGLTWGIPAFGPESMMYLTYHSDRPAQVESLPGNVQFFLPDPVVVNTYGSFNVTGPGYETLVALFTFLPLALVLVGVGVAGWQARGLGTDGMRRAAVRGAALATFAFAVYGKVLAWHYFFWPLPLMAMAHALWGFRHPRLVWGLYFCAVLLTTAINELYWTLEAALPAFVAMLTLRNALIFPVFFLMLLPVRPPGTKGYPPDKSRYPERDEEGV